MTIVNLVTIKDKEVNVKELTPEEQEELARELNRVALASIGYAEQKK